MQESLPSESSQPTILLISFQKITYAFIIRGKHKTQESLHPKNSQFKDQLMRIHDEIPEETEGILGKGFRQEISKLVLRLPV